VLPWLVGVEMEVGLARFGQSAHDRRAVASGQSTEGAPTMALLILLLVLGTTVWVAVDANKRDWSQGTSPTTWVIGMLLLWIVVFPVYLAKRGQAPVKP
jgi:heme/copper-type cytochrome/quinol oxidase subunit 2